MSRESRLRWIGLSLLFVVVAAIPGSANALMYEAHLPNLKPLAAFELELGKPDQEDRGERALRFSVAVQNLGAHPLELLGLPEGPESSRAQQCISFVGRACRAWRDAGEFVWHQNHAHWHFEGFALYELRTLDGERPDLNPSGLVAGGEKVSFCLMDSDPAEEDPGAYEDRWYSRCIGVLQGISPRWQDVYGSGLTGQQIVVDSVPDGQYALVVTIDPEDRLEESSEDDNTSALVIELSDGGSVVTSLGVIPED